MSVKPGVMFRASQAPVTYRERFHPAAANLQFLSCGEFEIAAGASSQSIAYPGEETLLYMWRGAACVALDQSSYPLATYDMLYVPKGKPFSISNPGSETIRLIVTRATAQNVHPVFHCEFAKCSKDESRIRHLKGRMCS
jgi:mannose-6-phosphate isomerase-like protein (cupin superfamily)